MFSRRVKTIAIKLLKSWWYAWSMIVFGFTATVVAAQNPVQYVNPRWGAGMDRFVHGKNLAGHAPMQPGLHSVGDMYPEIALPRPMAIWAPQTHTGYWFYNNLDPTFQGFRCTHEAHPWAGDYGQFNIMPEVGPVQTSPVKWASSFTHKREVAHPYSYRVYLPRYHTLAELAPTKRCGIFKFTFPKTSMARIVISAKDAAVKLARFNHHTVVIGHVWRNFGEVPKNFACRFVAQFSRQPSSATLFGAKGNRLGAVLTFNTNQARTLRMRIGTSFISVRQAEISLRREIPGWSVKSVAGRAKAVWNRQLKKIDIGGATASQKEIFYTSLYWVLLYPHSFYEINGHNQRVHYNPTNGKVYSGRFYTGTGFWDVYRCAFPLMTLIYRHQDGRVIRGFLRFYKEGGWLPEWPNPGYWNCMVGTDADAVIAEAYLQGIHGFSPSLAYDAIRKDGTVEPHNPGHGIPHLKDYLRLGYLPANAMGESTSTTLEEAYDDYAIAEMAKAMRKTADYKRFRKLAFNYRNVFDPKVKFPWGRDANGSWQPHFDPIWWGSPFTEDDAWTYQWMVMQDPYGLIKLLGGREATIKRLDRYFTMNSDFHLGGYASWGHPIPEENESKILGLGQYGPNNEPSSHDAFFYDFVQQPWKAQYWARQTMDRVYNTTGMVGDEDEGQMGAWYIFNTAGLYPFSPVRSFYLLSSPTVGRVTLHLRHGKTFTIRSIGNGPKDYYIQSATLNGRPFNRLWINQRTILRGGTLLFTMGAKPNRKWAANRAAMPPAGDMTQP